MRAAVYIRISQETAETTSPVRQRDACLKLAADRGWHVHDVYEDLDLSAYTGTRRPALDRLVDQLDRYDVLIVWKLDRLYRRFTGFASLLQTLEDHQVELVSVTEALDTTSPIGKGVAGLLAAQAEQESANTSLRVSSAQQHLTETGRWRGGTPPYGYRPADHPAGGRTLEPHPERAALVRQLARRIIEGESGRQLADWLNRQGIPTARGKTTWSSKTVLTLLRNPALTGQAVRHGQPLLGDDGIPLRPWPAVLDDVTFRAVQRALAGRDRRRGRARAGATLLSGLLVCGRCHGGMVGWTGDHPRASYACRTRAESGPSSCQGNSIKRAYTDRYVLLAMEHAWTADAIADFHEQLRRHRSDSPDPALHRTVELEDALDRLERDRVELGLYDDEHGRRRYAARYRELAGELARLRERRPAAGAALEDVLPPPGRALAEVWRGWPAARQRTLIGASVNGIVIGPFVGQKGRFNPDRIDIDWRTIS